MSAVQKAPGLYELAILSRVLRPGRGELSVEAARAILSLDFDPADRERMHDLALKAQDGLWGLVAKRFNLHLFSVRRHLVR